MGVQTTVVFTDLHGSTAVFEALGNARAAETVTQITTWIAAQCERFGGHVVKTLGDGVLAMFAHRMRHLSGLLGAELFIPADSLAITPAEFCRMVNQSRLNYISTRDGLTTPPTQL